MLTKKRKLNADDNDECDHYRRNVITEGDAKINTIQAHAYLYEISDTLCEVINNYKCALKDETYRDTKKKTEEFLRLIKKASKSITRGINVASALQKKRGIVKRLISERKADFNVDLKRKTLLKQDFNIRGSNDVNYLKYLLKIFETSTNDINEQLLREESNRESRKVIKKGKDNDNLFPTPSNNTHYTLKELILNIENAKLSVFAYYNRAILRKKTIVICSLKTLYRHYNLYKSQGVLPPHGYDGINEGRPRLIPDTDIKLLNKSLNTIGYAETASGLQDTLMSTISKQSELRGKLEAPKIPCAQTIDHYHTKAALNDTTVSMVKTRYTMNKTSRRQMASTSVRNLGSQVGAVAYSNFKVCVKRWDGYYKVSKGAQECIDIIQKVTGTFVEPINPAFLLNEDCSSQYFYSGVAPNSNKDKSYSRVKVESIEDRNRSSIWINSDSSEEPCSGIRVKFACGGSAAGFVYPIVILISGLSDSEMPKDDFLVVEMKGMGINGRIDPRNEEIGYVCFMKHDVKQLHFFDWFYQTITYPTIVAIRKRYNQFYEDGDSDEQHDHHNDKCILWGDSDIPYLQQMTSPERIADSMNKGIYFSKIGAKITETSQPLDLGPFFKILKMAGRNLTSVGTVSDMTITVDKMFKKLSLNKEIILSTGKLNTLKDCIVCSPDMMTKSFSTRTIQKAFVSSGMLDVKMKQCPDISGIINSFKVNWNKVEGGINWFMKMVPAIVLEFYKNGEILEQFYDDKEFPLDFDKNGKLYRLNSNANNMTRSSVLYHPSILQNKRETIKKANDLINSDQTKALIDAEQLFVTNKECEDKLVQLVLPGSTDSFSIQIAQEITIEMFHKCSALLLCAFIKVRLLNNLLDTYMMPLKGKPGLVRSGLTDKNTKGPFMIALAYQARLKPIVGTVPTLPPIETPPYSSSHQRLFLIRKVYLNWII